MENPMAVQMVTSCRKMPAKSHCGPFGLSVSALRAALTITVMEPSQPGGIERRLASPLATLLLQWSQGHMPQWLRTHVYNCSEAIMFTKPAPSTSIRPTGVGFGGRRVVSKAVLAQNIDAIRCSMCPAQRGLDIKGTEITSHMSRAFLTQEVRPDALWDAPCIFQADETNAFNNFSRDYALRLAKRHWPHQLYEYMELLYGSHNKIIMTTDSIMAERGSTQGCAFGMAMYCLTTVHPLIKATEALGANATGTAEAAAAGYADDVATMGTIGRALKGMAAYVEESRAICKSFNGQKCTFHTPSVALHQALVEAADQGSVEANGVSIVLKKNSDGCYIMVSDVPFRITKPPGVTVLGTPIGTNVYVHDWLDKQWDMEDRIILDRIKCMTDTQAAFYALKVLACSKPVYLMRSVPPPFMTAHMQRWDRALLQVVSNLLATRSITPFANELLRIKPVHGGAGIPEMASLSHIAYRSSLLGVTWTLAPMMDTFGQAAVVATSLPSILYNNRDSSEAAKKQCDAMIQEQQDGTQWTPASNVVRSWRHIMSLQTDAMGRLFGGPEDEDTSTQAVTPQDLEARAKTAKFQRELALRDSQQARDSLWESTHEDLQTQKDNGQPIEYQRAIRRHIHARTQWRMFHSMLPWIPVLRVDGSSYAAAVRFQLLLRSSRSVALGPMMLCKCRAKHSHPRMHSDPEYHAMSCGFASLIRKFAHNHIVRRVVSLLAKSPTVGAKEPDNPELAGAGAVPDVILSHRRPSPSSNVPPPQFQKWSSLDIRVSSIVYAADYKRSPEAMKNRPDPRQTVFADKLKKHRDAGNECFPVVLDFAGNLFPKTLGLLQDLMGETGKQHLGLFKRECAASMCRMIGHLDNRNATARTIETEAIPPTADEAASQDLFGEAYDPIDYGRSGEGEPDCPTAPRPIASVAATAGTTQDAHQDVPAADFFSFESSTYDFSSESFGSSASASASALQ